MNGSHPQDGLGRRLRALADHHVSDANRQQHLMAIDAELARHHVGAPADASGDPGRSWLRQRTRRWVAGMVAATALFVPAGAAVAASQHALPGDMLYPVKQWTEPVRGVFHADVAARHRLDELEALLAREASPERLQGAVEAARAAVAGLPADHWLHERLAGLLAPPATPHTPSNGPAPVPAPSRATPSPPGDPDRVVDDDAHDDADPTEPHDKYDADLTEPHDAHDSDESPDDMDAEHSDDADGEDDDGGSHDPEVSDEADDNGPDDDAAEADDDIEEPDGGEGTDEVEDDAPDDDDRTGDDEAEDDDHDA